MALSVVDLPAPLRPISATISPRADLERHVEQDLRLAVGGVEAFDFEDGRLGHARLTPPALPRRAAPAPDAAAQIDLAHAGVGAHLVRPAGGDDLAAHQHDDVVGMREHGVHVVLGEEHADAALAGDAGGRAA